MTGRHRRTRLLVGLLPLLAVAALSGCSTDSHDEACETVDNAVLKAIASHPVDAVSSPEDEFTVTEGAAVASAEHGSGYVVGAQIRAKGIATGPGYWWVDTVTGTPKEISVVAPFADQFTTWPFATDLDPPVTAGGVDEVAARECLVGK